MRSSRKLWIELLELIPRMRIILASRSPRRRDLLHAAGIPFEIITADAEESFEVITSPDDLCMNNASLKARAVAIDYPHDCVIGADTLVFLDNEPLGKPANREEAKATLARLSGRTHFVCTGVSLVTPSGEYTFAVRTDVVFRDLDEAVIDEYLSRVDVLDKAGSYAWQEHGELIISRVDGAEDNVIGLPVSRLVDELRACGCLDS